MSIPTTMSEMQKEVLAGDLEDNPYLTSSPIPSRDNKLKTTSQKIIGAINELLTSLIINKQSIETYSIESNEKIALNTLAIETIATATALNAENIIALSETAGTGTGSTTNVKKSLFFQGILTEETQNIALPVDIDICNMEVFVFGFNPTDEDRPTYQISNYITEGNSLTGNVYKAYKLILDRKTGGYSLQLSNANLHEYSDFIIQIYQ